MKKDVEVLVIIICDQQPEEIPEDKDIARVRQAVANVSGVKETYLAPNTADIAALASWEEAEIPEKVSEIKEIPGVKKVETKILVPV